MIVFLLPPSAEIAIQQIVTLRRAERSTAAQPKLESPGVVKRCQKYDRAATAPSETLIVPPSSRRGSHCSLTNSPAVSIVSTELSVRRTVRLSDYSSRTVCLGTGIHTTGVKRNTLVPLSDTADTLLCAAPARWGPINVDTTLTLALSGSLCDGLFSFRSGLPDHNTCFPCPHPHTSCAPVISVCVAPSSMLALVAFCLRA